MDIVFTSLFLALHPTRHIFLAVYHTISLGFEWMKRSNKEEKWGEVIYFPFNWNVKIYANPNWFLAWNRSNLIWNCQALCLPPPEVVFWVESCWWTPLGGVDWLLLPPGNFTRGEEWAHVPLWNCIQMQEIERCLHTLRRLWWGLNFFLCVSQTLYCWLKHQSSFLFTRYRCGPFSNWITRSSLGSIYHCLQRWLDKIAKLYWGWR